MAMKKKIKIILIVFGVIVFVWYGYVGAVKYKNWKWWQGVKNEAAKFEKEIADKKAKIAADTYGGKTPQETLDMFIAAVEKGDYELASKYFVVERQIEWKDNLVSIAKDNKLNIFLNPLKEARNNIGEYSENKKIYLINNPISVDLILYHSNLWKIDEI